MEPGPDQIPFLMRICRQIKLLVVTPGAEGFGKHLPVATLLFYLLLG